MTHAAQRSWLLACVGIAAGGFAVCGCAPSLETAGGLPVRLQQAAVRLHDHPLTLHLGSTPGVRVGGPLLVYATGDAGWWGGDKAIFSVLAQWGYPVVGFSARAYVHHLGPGSDVERPAQVAEDYGAIIAAAEATLGLPPATGVVLVGKSRGAGLEIAAAATSRLRGALEGVLAVGLTREEEYVERRRRGNRPAGMLQTYAALPRIGRLPVAVIQSVHDQYVPAAEARTLFGPDTDTRRLLPIEAADHNFRGAIPALYAEMASSVAWIIAEGRGARGPNPAPPETALAAPRAGR